jgi:hypothetical protein
MASIDRMAQHFGDFYVPELVHTVKYILKNKFIRIVKEQCSDQEASN